MESMKIQHTMAFSTRNFHYGTLITIFMCLQIGSSNGLRILAVFPFPMNSMNVITEPLAIGLAEKGHQVDVYSHFPPKKSIPNLSHFNLLGTLPAVINNISFTEMAGPSYIESLKIWIRGYGQPQCELLGHPLFQKLLNDPPKDPPYDLVLVEITVAFCYFALGRHFNVPMIFIENTILPSYHYEPFGVPLNLATDSSVQLSYTHPLTFFERMNNFYSHYVATYFFNYYVVEQDQYVEKYFGKGYPSVTELQKDSSLVLINYDPATHGIRTFPPIFVPVSGLHVVDRNEKLSQVVQKWLDDSKDGCIYVSFGSMARIETLPKKTLEIFYKTFENLAPVRVLMKIAKPKELPPGLPSNVLTQSWLPQILVLKHKNIKAFVTHGGLMGTTESIYQGVPMIGVPMFFDQFFNIQSLVKRKTALQINYDEISEDKFTSSLKEILNNPMYKNNAMKIRDKSKDRPMSPMDTAVFWIEYVHRHGKDALKSPIVDLPWWQASLLDIYACLVGLALMILFTSFLIIKKTVDFCRPKTQKNFRSKQKKN